MRTESFGDPHEYFATTQTKCRDICLGPTSGYNHVRTCSTHVQLEGVTQIISDII